MSEYGPPYTQIPSAPVDTSAKTPDVTTVKPEESDQGAPQVPLTQRAVRRREVRKDKQFFFDDGNFYVLVSSFTQLVLLSSHLQFKLGR